jgi:hypothetical protein
VAPHEDQGVDSLVQGDPDAVALVGVLCETRRASSKGLFAAKTPGISCRSRRLRDGPVFGDGVVGGVLGFFSRRRTIAGDLLGVGFRDIDQLVATACMASLPPEASRPGCRPSVFVFPASSRPGAAGPASVFELTVRRRADAHMNRSVG